MIIYVNYCLDTLTTILRQYSNFAWPISQINLLVWESMCRKSIFDDSFCVKVPPNVFHFAKCWFIRPVSVNSITSCDRTPRGHIPMSFMVADHRLVCIRKTLGTVFPLQLSIVEHMFIVLSQ